LTSADNTLRTQADAPSNHDASQMMPLCINLRSIADRFTATNVDARSIRSNWGFVGRYFNEPKHFYFKRIPTRRSFANSGGIVQPTRQWWRLITKATTPNLRPQETIRLFIACTLDFGRLDNRESQSAGGVNLNRECVPNPFQVEAGKCNTIIERGWMTLHAAVFYPPRFLFR